MYCMNFCTVILTHYNAPSNILNVGQDTLRGTVSDHFKAGTWSTWK